MKKLTHLTYLIMLCCFLIGSFGNEIKAQSLYINEILASNSNVNADEYGEADDWIELYNASPSPIDIGGMYLTDDLTNLTKWNIPSNQPLLTTIPEFGFLLIWCDDQANQGPLHAPFKLSSSGENIALVATDGASVIDYFTFGVQSANVSLAREQDGQLPWSFFASPTPNETNTGNNPIATMPVASQNGGHYNNSFSVNLSTTTVNGIIRYTTDGSEPTDNADIYTTPLNIDETTVLRARTFATNMDPSRTMTHTYLFDIDHEFPIFCLSTDDDNIWGDEDGIYIHYEDDIEQPIHVELFEADGSFGFRQDMGIQIHGRHSQTYPHKGLSFRARNKYGNNKINYQLFPNQPFDEYGSFILRASGNDWKRMLCRDAMASSLVRDMADVDSLIKDPEIEMQGYRPTVVYLNGEYFGIHNLREKLDYRYLNTHYGIPKGAADVMTNSVSLEHGNKDAWKDYQEFLEEADFTIASDLEELKANIEIDHFFDYFIFNIFIDNNDWPGNNNRRWRLREPGEKWRFFVYDLDGCFGLNPLSDNYNSGDWDSPSVEMVMADTETYSHNEPYSTVCLRKLMENDTMRIKFINRMADQLNILFTKERVLERIDEFEALYIAEIPQHTDFWWDGDDDWDEDMDIARLFATHRTQEVFNQFHDYWSDDIDAVVDLTLNASPTAGGVIHLNTMNVFPEQYPWTGTHFAGIDVPLYTVPNPGYIFTGWTPATLGDDPITTMNLSGNGTITAHFDLGSTQIGNIVINEINYHSPSFCDAGDWVELHNAGTESVDISGWFLEDGSGNYFNIPANTSLEAGGFLVLAQDGAKFSTIHPQVTNFISSFGNSLTGGFGLSNGGEWIAINNADRSFQDTVHYNDNFPWPSEADGTGPSLELYNPSLDNALAQSWFAVPSEKGSPGEVNQGVLQLGEDITICGDPNTVTLDASYTPCVNCTYLWNNGAIQPTIAVNPLEGNNIYTVTVTDGSGVTQTDNITIVVSEPFSLNIELQESCFGADNGSINLSVNGTGTYSYDWSNGSTIPDIGNLATGTYTVTVSNALSCTQTQTVELTSFPELLLEEEITGLLCYNDLGAINLTMSGGMAPYTYSWSNGAIVEDLSDLPEGDYEVTVTDANNCTVLNTYQLDAAPPTLAGSLTSMPSCFGTNEGVVNADITGGIGDYFYQWSNGEFGTSGELNGLSPDFYQLTVTDENGCTWFGETEVIGSTTINTDFTVSSLACPGDNSGMVSLSVNGGLEPYTYLWDNQETGESLQNLSAGIVGVTITDATQCQHYDSIYISEPDALALAAEVNPASCFEGADGNISVIASGGTGTFNYEWNNGLSGNEIDNLTEGNYEVTITDSNNCEHIENIYLSNPSPITLDFDVDPISCSGGTDGAISTITTGGTGTLNYEWNNGNSGNTIDNLPQGNYEVTITDNNNCGHIENIYLPNPSPITLDFEVDPVSCFDGIDGNISLTASGGTGTFDYEWNNGDSGAEIDNLMEGNYTVTISDSNECEHIEDFYVSEAPAIVLDFEVDTITCFGEMDGNISVTASGGTGTFDYEWSNGDSGDEIDNLTEGTYNITITDANDCEHIEQIYLPEASPIILDIEMGSISCFGLNDGNILVNVSGGTGTFDYEWNSGDSGNMIDNLPEGNYEISITDSNNCEHIENIYLPEPSPIALDFEVNPISCSDGMDGTITADASGGTGALNYEWNNGNSGDEIDNLAEGTYEVTITDNNNCGHIENIYLPNPSPITLDFEVDPVSCFEGIDGNISLTASGGTGTFDYEWNNGDSGAEIDNLMEGNYTVTITDSNECEHIEDFYVSEAPAIVLDIEVDSVSCFEGMDGNVSVIASGGTGALIYEWDNGNSGNQIDNLIAGTYEVTIIDNNNCEQSGNAYVSEPPAIVLNIGVDSVSCFEGIDGSVSVIASGGTGTLNYEWDNGDSGNQIDNLIAGTYEVTISDSNNCEQFGNVSVSEPPAIVLDIEVDSVSCFEGMDGSVSVTASGGTGTYDYEWNNGDTGNQIDNLMAGTYEVTITDNNNCEQLGNVSVSEPPAIVLDIEMDSVSCFEGTDGSISLTTSGGTGTFNYNWSTGSNASMIDNLTEGSYEVTITDSNDCKTEESFYLDQPSILIAESTSTNPNASTGGSITVTADGGTMPYSILWEDGATTFALSELPAGSYSYTITDSNGCYFEETVVLEFIIAVANPDAYTISIYPNPSKGIVYIENNLGSMTIDVYDLLGRSMRQFVQENAIPLWEVDLGGLQAGVYCFKIQSEGVEFIQLVVVE